MTIEEYVHKFIREMKDDPDIKPADIMTLGGKLMMEGFAMCISKDMGVGAAIND